MIVMLVIKLMMMETLLATTKVMWSGICVAVGVLITVFFASEMAFFDNTSK